MKSVLTKFASASFLFTSLLSFSPAQERGPLLLVSNKGDQTLSLVDPVAGKELATVDEKGITGHEVIASPDGKLAFVPIFGNSGVGKPGTDGQIIQVIDLAKKEIVNSIDFGKGVRPHCPIFNAKNGLLYVTTELLEAVAIIDPATLKIVGSIPTGKPESHMLTLSHDGHRGYTANVGSGTVSVLDLDEKKLLTTIQVANIVQRICVSPDDRWAFTSDQLNPRIAMIDTAKNEVKQWIEIPSTGYGAAIIPNGRLMVIALPTTNQAAIIDLELLKVVNTLDLPKAPQEVLITPDGKTAFVSCDASKQVASIDIATRKVSKLIDVGKTCDGMAWAK